ncbi:MAG TPA: NAD(P)H-binding protein [Candidatus Limnocylindria bacterium]|nr:NAD(P)H-binding protein [Candidatus Limnocylindria bacterium]
MPTDAVTGATSYTGRFIAERLVAAGRSVVDITRRPQLPHPLGAAVSTAELDVAHPDRLAATLDGVDTLYNTFWIRFERGPITYAWATERCLALFAAARRAGVRQVVHISVINAAADAPTAYFRAKAAVEEALAGSGVAHAIVRPTVTFGPGDILLNNLAWTLRRLPVFGIPGDGRYPIQPVHIDDIADLAVGAASLSSGTIVDAAGPDTYTFREFVALVRQSVGSHALVVPMPVDASLLAARLIGLAVRDVVLRRDEVTELQAGLMRSAAPPTGRIRLADWLAAHAAEIGRRWANELDRHFRGG